MKKLFIIFCCMFALTGCSSHGKIGELAYLRGAALDSGSLTMTFYTDEDDITVTADDLDSAISSAELKLGKRIFTGHTQMILLGSCDELKTLEHMLHKWKVSPSCVVITGEQNGGEIIRSHDTEQLTGAVKMAQEQGKLGKCDIVSVLAKLMHNS